VEQEMNKGKFINRLNSPVLEFELPSGNSLYLGLNDKTLFELLSRSTGFALKWE
jgi:hypothetical protein